MPRPRSIKTDEVKSKLIQRLRAHGLRPGERFLSNRQVAGQYGVSYQTAHRIVGELVAEGVLARRPASGTYVPGRSTPTSAVLLFNARARRPGSFGARLLGDLKRRLARERLPFTVCHVDPSGSDAPGIDPRALPVAWELHHWLAEHWPAGQAAVLLNDRPASGLEAVYCDSVSVDDLTGGACAAQLLVQRSPARRRLCVLSGPAGDRRSDLRLAGFRSVVPAAAVVQAAGWTVEDGVAQAPAAVGHGRDGIFACNDRLAEAVILHCQTTPQRCPRLVGFDDAPVAERLDLATIAVPWDELVGGAVTVIRKRLAGDTSAASAQVFMPRPVLRGSLQRASG